jgi:hypothetical protein
MKDHLRLTKGSGFDRKHPADHVEWTRIENENFLVRVPRSGPAEEDLDEEEVAEMLERKHASQKKHYETHRDTILPVQRKRQKVARERAKLCNQVGKIADEAIAAVLNTETALNEAISQAMLNRKFICSLFARPKSLTEFAQLDEPVALQRFPRMIAYLLPPQSIPSILESAPGDIIINILPNQSHFRKASSLVHTDKRPGSTDYFKYLSEAWRQWKPYFHNYSALEVESGSEATTEALDLSAGELDGEVAGEVVLDESLKKEIGNLSLWNGEAEESEFRAKGQSYARLVDMYWAYHVAAADALEELYPKQISPWTLVSTFEDLDDAERAAAKIRIDTSAVKAEGVDSMIKAAIEGDGAVQKKRGRKRKQPVEPSESEDV